MKRKTTKSKRHRIPFFHVRIGNDYIVGFAYPPRLPNGKYRDVGQREHRVAEGIYALLGTDAPPYEWVSETAESSATHVAALVGGKLERMER